MEQASPPLDIPDHPRPEPRAGAGVLGAERGSVFHRRTGAVAGGAEPDLDTPAGDQLLPGYRWTQPAVDRSHCVRRDHGAAGVVARAPGRERILQFQLLWVLGAITGVFLALDLLLFYFFWEIMLVPTYFLFLWGYERRYYAAVKFFIFTQLSGLLMLLAILGLFFVHGQDTGTFTFNYNQLLGTAIDPRLASWLDAGLLHRLRREVAGRPCPLLAARCLHPVSHRPAPSSSPLSWRRRLATG